LTGTNDALEQSRGCAQLVGKYSNHFMVGHNAFEFLLDFGHCSPEDEEGYFHTRIIASPSCAKALLELFRESIEQYEKTFGLIRGS
jgi:Protein of unknown function (DUF3467)